MNHLTIDASVALKFLLDEPGSEAARAYRPQEENGRLIVRNVLLAPALVLLEVHNTLAKKFHNAEIDVETFAKAPEFLRQLMRFDDVDWSLIERARHMSYLANTLSGRNPSRQPKAITLFNIYDCIYLAHAQKYETTLLTADEVQAEIARKAFSIPVECIAVSTEH